MNNDEKGLAGKISALIILFLTIISIVYKIFNLDYATMGSIVECIDDASMFMTAICLLIGVYALIRLPRDNFLIILCIIDIITVNHLYSNIQLRAILEWFMRLNKRLLIFCGIILLGIVVFVYMVMKKKKKTKELQEEDTNIHKIDNSNINIPLNLYGQEVSEMHKVSEIERTAEIDESIEKKAIHKNEARGDEKAKRVVVLENTHKFLQNQVALLICIVIVLSGVLDYVFFELIPLEIQRPKILESIKDVLYSAAILCLAIIMAWFIIWLFRQGRNQIAERAERNIHLSPFSLTAIFAVFFEIVIVYLIMENDGKAEVIIDYFLTAVSDNLFTALIALIITFLILQIFCTIIFHFITTQQENDDIIEILKNGIKKIEKRMVKTSCEIIDSCLSLVDFIPDFFRTIGVLLLNKPVEEHSDE